MRTAKALAALLAAGGALAWAAAPGTAQDYRSDMPAVLDGGQGRTQQDAAGAERPDAAAIRAAFGEAYARQDRPRLAVYWNRTFSERLRQWVAARRLRIDRAAEGRRGDDELEARSDTTVAVQRNRGQARQRATGLDRLAEARFEAGFSGPFLDSAVRLVDRATIMRVTDSNLARGPGAERPDDARLVETEALKGFADYVLEITVLPDAAGPEAPAVRVRAKRIPDGVIVADIVTRGRPPTEDPETTWVAGEAGYEKMASGKTLRAGALGRHVALQAMDALARRWQ